jgi:hypothetical protein
MHSAGCADDHFQVDLGLCATMDESNSAKKAKISVAKVSLSIFLLLFF